MKKDFELKPAPIMKLNRTVGVHPQYCSQSVHFMKGKFKDVVIFGSANMLV